LNDCIEEVQIQSARSISRPRNLKSGWIKAGLFPFNPDRVLRDIQKPLAKLTVPKVDEMKMGSCPQGEVLRTPVTAEALTSLRNLIEQDAHALDETSKQRLQKLANAAQITLNPTRLLSSSLVSTLCAVPPVRCITVEVHAHEAYAPETDEHCAVFTIRHLLPHRSTLSPTGLSSRAPVASHENLLPYHEYLLPPTLRIFQHPDLASILS
jgi:hypothetical protein